MQLPQRCCSSQAPVTWVPASAVGFQRGQQRQAQFAQQRLIAPHLLEHRVDQQRLATGAVGQQVGVGRGDGVEQLAEGVNPGDAGGMGWPECGPVRETARIQVAGDCGGGAPDRAGGSGRAAAGVSAAPRAAAADRAAPGGLGQHQRRRFEPGHPGHTVDRRGHVRRQVQAHAVMALPRGDPGVPAARRVAVVWPQAQVQRFTQAQKGGIRQQVVQRLFFARRVATQVCPPARAAAAPAGGAGGRGRAPDARPVHAGAGWAAG